MEIVGISSKIRMQRMRFAILVVLVGCSSNGSGQHPVLAAPPPQDDGRPSEGGAGGAEHAAALEQLKTAPMNFGIDRQNAIKIPLPDSPNWMRVKFCGVKSL